MARAALRIDVSVLRNSFAGLLSALAEFATMSFKDEVAHRRIDAGKPGVIEGMAGEFETPDDSLPVKTKAPIETGFAVRQINDSFDLPLEIRAWRYSAAWTDVANRAAIRNVPVILMDVWRPRDGLWMASNIGRCSRLRVDS